MVWMLGGYMWLFVHRPFEVWPWLGDFQIERIYMLLMIAFWAVQPNKGWLPNRLHAALVAFTLVLTMAWVASPFMYSPGCRGIGRELSSRSSSFTSWSSPACAMKKA